MICRPLLIDLVQRIEELQAIVKIQLYLWRRILYQTQWNLHLMLMEYPLSHFDFQLLQYQNRSPDDISVLLQAYRPAT